MEHVVCFPERVNARVSEDEKYHFEKSARLLELSCSEYARLLVSIPINLINDETEVNFGYDYDLSSIVYLAFDKKTMVQLNYQMLSWMYQYNQGVKAIETISNRRNIPDRDSFKLGRELKAVLDDVEAYRIEALPQLLAIVGNISEKQIARNEHIQWRLTEEEHSLLVSNAQLLETNLSDFIRILIRLPHEFVGMMLDGNGLTIYFDTASLKLLVTEIRQWGRTLNKSIHALNTICSKKAIPVKEAVKLYEDAVANVRDWDDRKRSISALFDFVSNGEFVPFGRF